MLISDNSTYFKIEVKVFPTRLPLSLDDLLLEKYFIKRAKLARGGRITCFQRLYYFCTTEDTIAFVLKRKRRKATRVFVLVSRKKRNLSCVSLILSFTHIASVLVTQSRRKDQGFEKSTFCFSHIHPLSFYRVK